MMQLLANAPSLRELAFSQFSENLPTIHFALKCTKNLEYYYYFSTFKMLIIG
jgi:hypothetical protein